MTALTVAVAWNPYWAGIALVSTLNSCRASGNGNGKLTKFLNLEDAFAAWEKNPGPREWRTHFHVPVFLDDLGEFGTTRFAIEDALKFHKAKPLSRQLEIETYTWDVLPDHLKTGDIVDYVCRELEWVHGQLS